MVKVLKVLFVVAVVATLTVPAFAQNANSYNYLNGVDYFFFNINLPPKNGDIAYRCFPSSCLYGSRSSTIEATPHNEALQNEGFILWNGQAGTPPGLSAPLGFSLILFRTQQGDCVLQTAPTCGASFGASWSTSLPCAAPWFWIITFTWVTPLTIPTCANPKPGYQVQGPLGGTGTGLGGNLLVGVSGENNQTIANQNYFTGSGNERNLNPGGISYFFDGTTFGVFQLVGAQEWSHTLFNTDATARTGRHPSATAAAPKILDFGTGGFSIRQACSPYGKGDAAKFRTYDSQDAGAGFNYALLTCGVFGDFISPNLGITVPSGDGRRFDIVTDPCTGISLQIPVVFKLLPGAPGVYETPFEVPMPAFSAAFIPFVTQHININTTAGSFGAISSTASGTLQ
jgi:hypothetical protein